MYELIHSNENVSENLRWLSNGPSPQVQSYSAYAINGYNFETKDRDSVRVTQNSSVTCIASTMQISSSKDQRPITSDMSYYGVIVEIWDINYNSFTIPVFKCEWVQNASGVKVDEFGFTLVDLKKLGHKSDPFILASQAKQIFYVTDPVDEKWSVVCHMPSRGYPTSGDNEEVDSEIDCPPLMVQVLAQDGLVDDDSPLYMRDGNEGIWIVP